MKKLLRKVMGNRVALAVLVGVPLAVGLWRLGALALQPRHLREAAAELGTVGNFVFTPMPNHAGTRVAFSQSTDEGAGLFLATAGTGKRVLLAEKTEREYNIRVLRPLGWSPDDKLFAFLCRTNVLGSDGKPRAQSQLILCDGASGEVKAKIPIRSVATGLSWLTATSFAITDEMQDVSQIRLGSDQQWTRPRTFNKPVRKPAPAKGTPAVKKPLIQWLTALTADYVVYQQEGELWGWKFDADEPERLWESPTNKLVNVAALPDRRGVFLHYTNTCGSFAARFLPATRRLTELGCISPQAGSVLKALPLGGGNGCVWLAADLGQYSVLVKTNFEAPAALFLARGSVERLCDSEAAVCAVGSLTNEPPAIWQYDLGGGTPRLLVANPERPFHYARNASLETGAFTNKAGEVLTYHLLAPPGVSPRNKYPVLLGQSPYGWRGYQNAVANAGAYWMSVDRPAFHHPRRDRWIEDVISGYELVAAHPNMDTNSVYLYGSSAEVWYVNTLAADRPELWKGVVLFHPGIFPDLSRVKIQKAFVDAGELDERGARASAKFQEDALRAGVRVSFLVYADSGHTMNSRAMHRERAEQLSRFVNEN
jgi:hypothetical protein